MASDLASLRASAADHGLKELRLRESSFPGSALVGYRPPGGILHFGYRDGITEPLIDWTDSGSGGVNFREFITGYPSEDYNTKPQHPGTWQDFAREGSFACLAWAYQDVAKFNKFLRDNAEAAEAYAETAGPQEWLAAKMLGRWRKGAPLALYPGGQPADAELGEVLKKDFGYADDPAGLKCPLTGHIRVVNPRDQKLNEPSKSTFPLGPPRLIRRGYSYGNPLEPEGTTEDDGEERGLVGLFFCGRIREQIYTVLRWMQKTDFSDEFDNIRNGMRAQDPLCGNRSHPDANTNLVISQEGKNPLSLPLQDFIRYRGVAILFAPGLASLRVLSGQ
jgi:deferrochelatase/peroxidase EfeB